MRPASGTVGAMTGHRKGQGRRAGGRASSRGGRGGSAAGRGRPQERPASLRKSTLPREVVAEIESTGRAGKAGHAVRLLEQAIEAIERGRPDEAGRLAEEAKAQAPRAPGIREVLGLAYYQAERYREALRELQSFRRISGRREHNHLIADCHRALGAPEKAVPLAQEALRARIPEAARAEAAVVGGAALADLGRFDEAVAMLRRFPTRDAEARPYDLRIWYVLGDVLERSGRPSEAAREFQKIVRHDPDAFDAVERLARIG